MTGNRKWPPAVDSDDEYRLVKTASLDR